MCGMAFTLTRQILIELTLYYRKPKTFTMCQNETTMHSYRNSPVTFMTVNYLAHKIL